MSLYEECLNFQKIPQLINKIHTLKANVITLTFFVNFTNYKLSIPLLHPIPTTICNRVSPKSVLKLGLSPRLTIDLNFSTFFALTDSSI